MCSPLNSRPQPRNGSRSKRPKVDGSHQIVVLGLRDSTTTSASFDVSVDGWSPFLLLLVVPSTMLRDWWCPQRCAERCCASLCAAGSLQASRGLTPGGLATAKQPLRLAGQRTPSASGADAAYLPSSRRSWPSEQATQGPFRDRDKGFPRPVLLPRSPTQRRRPLPRDGRSPRHRHPRYAQRPSGHLRPRSTPHRQWPASGWPIHGMRRGLCIEFDGGVCQRGGVFVGVGAVRVRGCLSGVSRS